MGNVSDESCIENRNAHFLFNNLFFSKKPCRLLGNLGETKYCGARQVADDDIIRHTHIPGWITKAANTHSEHVIFITFSLQQWSQERASVLPYTFIACLCRRD